MKDTPIDDAVETALSGARIFVRDVLINTPEELEQALKALEDAPEVLSSGTSRDDLEVSK